MKSVDYSEFKQIDAPCLDTRSPAEFDQSHIPGAKSFPLFNNEERQKVGTSYKQEGKNEAVKLGLDLVGPKMRSFVEQAEAFGSSALKIYCWRGGMRSGSLGWLLSQAGFEVYQLKGGYKAFRHHLLSVLKEPYRLKILSGLTGAGKTEVLKEMARMEAQVIDLEGLANHPGSSFGNALGHVQPSTETFQNEILMQLEAFDYDRPIWVEDESLGIGRVYLPEEFFQQMKASPRYFLDMPMTQRVDLLVRQYGSIPRKRLIEATRAIQKKLGNKETEQVIELITAGDLAEASRIILTYYDRSYQKKIKNKKGEGYTFVSPKDLSYQAIARQIIEEHGH